METLTNPWATLGQDFDQVLLEFFTKNEILEWNLTMLIERHLEEAFFNFFVKTPPPAGVLIFCHFLFLFFKFFIIYYDLSWFIIIFLYFFRFFLCQIINDSEILKIRWHAMKWHAMKCNFDFGYMQQDVTLDLWFLSYYSWFY